METFKEGDSVEVRSRDGSAWYEAVVVRLYPISRYYAVKYSDVAAATQAQDEDVLAARVRPRPPRRGPTGGPRIYELVEVFARGGWQRGVVSSVGHVAGSEELRYVVHFPERREDKEFGPAEVRRIPLDWDDGEWVPVVEKGISGTLFTEGTQVEVARVTERLPIAWYPAVVTKVVVENILVVEYEDLKTRDTLLKEIVMSQYVRPCPPHASACEKFNMLDEVEAFFGGGWWPGVVATVNGSRYNIKFFHSEEEVEFAHEKLRLLYDWIDGEWVRESQGKSMKSQEFGSKQSDGHMQLQASRSPNQCSIPVLIISSSSEGDGVTCKLSTCSTNEEAKNMDLLSERPFKKSKNSETTKDDTNLLDYSVTSRATNTLSRVNTGLDFSTPGIAMEPNFRIKAIVEDHSSINPLEKINGTRYQQIAEKRRKKTRPRKLTITEGGSSRSRQDDHVSGREPPSGGLSISHPEAITHPDTLVEAQDATIGSHDANLVETIPFEKRSSKWDDFETMEIFSRMPQQPHFRPLNDQCREDREGLALGLMATFVNLMTSIGNLQIMCPRSQFDETLNALLQLEEHGFSVERARVRVTELLTIKLNAELVATKRSELKEKLMEKQKARDQLTLQVESIKNRVLDSEHFILKVKGLRSSTQQGTKNAKISKLQEDSKTVDNDLLSAENMFEAFRSADFGQTL